jgi:hypothetical protein
VSPDGSVVILGSGLVHDAQTLARLPGGLGNTVSDIAWLKGAVYTVRSIAGYSQFQQWVGPTFAPGLVMQVQGTPQRLMNVNGKLVGIYTPASGVPQFVVMNKNFGNDVTPPTVQAGALSVSEGRITLTASETLGTSAGAPTVTLLPGGSPINLEPGTVDGNKVTFNLPASLVNGNYRLTLPPGAMEDGDGNGLAAAYTFDFFVLAGDINRDRNVDGVDFATLASNFGKSGMAFGQGDLNGDGKVDGSDFAILAGNFGKTVPALQAAAVAAPAPAPAAPAPAPAAAPTPRPTASRTTTRRRRVAPPKASPPVRRPSGLAAAARGLGR